MNVRRIFALNARKFPFIKGMACRFRQSVRIAVIEQDLRSEIHGCFLSATAKNAALAYNQPTRRKDRNKCIAKNAI